jgi:S1-C subfamily serine protease
MPGPSGLIFSGSGVDSPGELTEKMPMPRQFPRLARRAAFAGQVLLALACGDLLDRLDSSRGESARQEPFREERHARALPDPPQPPAPGESEAKNNDRTDAEKSVVPGKEPDPVPPPNTPSDMPPPALPIVPLGPHARTEDEDNSISVFRAVAASTVFVTKANILFDRFSRPVEVPVGTGSGFIWDTKGHVVTNFHVVEGARRFSVTMHDHKSFDAELVGTDKRKDIAVLRLDGAPANLQPIRVERGLELSVGQKTLAIGNPFGLDQTLTTGVISALGRSVPGVGGVTIRDMVQTDAAINPGNSGGPLLDSSGRLIGMNTMIYSGSGSSAGIGFAVPVDAIARVVPQIIRGGKPDRVGIGIGIDPSRSLERQYRIDGVLVIDVAEGGPADKAGLKGAVRTRDGISFSDVIVAIDGAPIKNYDDFYNALDRHDPGQTVKITVQRGEERLDFPVELMLLP